MLSCPTKETGFMNMISYDPVKSCRSLYVIEAEEDLNAGIGLLNVPKITKEVFWSGLKVPTKSTSLPTNVPLADLDMGNLCSQLRC